MQALERALTTLRSLCRHSHGPLGEETLVFSAPDPPVITADGRTILRAWQQGRSAPDAGDDRAVAAIERLVLDAADGIYRELGDGTSSFVLLLDALVREAARAVRGDRAERLRLVQAFAAVRWDWDNGALAPEDLAKLHISCHVYVDPKTHRPTPESRAMLVQVLTAGLTGTVGSSLVPQLVQCVLDWVFALPLERGPRDTLYRRCQRFLEHAPRAILHARGADFGASHVVESHDFILQKGLVPSQLPNLLHRGVDADECKRFLCLQGQLGLETGSNVVTLACDDRLGTLDSSKALVARFLHRLRGEFDVDVLISTEAVAPHVVAVCTELGIACVQYAEPEEIAALCTSAGIIALTCVFDDVDPQRHIGLSRSGVAIVKLQERPFLHFRGLEPRANATNMGLTIPQFIIYAPTPGVYKQYYNAILKTLRILRSCWRPSADVDKPHTISLCRGAGATELAIASCLRRAIREPKGNRSNRMYSHVVEMLAAALVELVVQLRANNTRVCGEDGAGISAPMSQSRRMVLGLSAEASNKGFVVDFDCAVVTRLGRVCIPEHRSVDPLSIGIVHPWQRMTTLIHSVLQTMERLMRIDAVVYVKKDRTATSNAEAIEHEHDDEPLSP